MLCKTAQTVRSRPVVYSLCLCMLECAQLLQCIMHTDVQANIVSMAVASRNFLTISQQRMRTYGRTSVHLKPCMQGCTSLELTQMRSSLFDQSCHQYHESDREVEEQWYLCIAGPSHARVVNSSNLAIRCPFIKPANNAHVVASATWAKSRIRLWPCCWC